ncbi:hypothetical protein ACJMK2_044295 [Sinanodonta woodiana]|uniref:Uncharacterized protein n=1 Tax=Sinanodonta woodiana TaxID=1069815 RepID=A0ABD3W080_SINWO
MVIKDYIPRLKMENLREKELLATNIKETNDHIVRQSVSHSLRVGIPFLEIHRNKLTKKVKLLDVKLSFSYQENYQTETLRLEKQLVRHGNKWVWSPDDPNSKNVITFPYFPGDRVNLNIGIIIHKTKKHGVFGKDTITTQAGTVTECVVLAKSNGVGMGLPLNSTITHNIRLYFNLNGYGHILTLKLRLEQEAEDHGPSMLWLRPMSSDKRFRSSLSAAQLLQGHNLPPKEKEEDFRNKMYICNHQRLVNYQRNPVLECWSVRRSINDSEIPTGIQLRQVIGGQTVAYLIPVVVTEQEKRYRLAIMVVTAEGPQCLCSAKWKCADKFDFRIHFFGTGQTKGQRIKWASKDFLNIDYIILNSTGHQFIMDTDDDDVLKNLCIGLCVKFLVRWCNEPLPWKRSGGKSMDEVQKQVRAKSSQYVSRCTAQSPYIKASIDSQRVENHIKNLASFLESHDLQLFGDVEEAICDELDENAKENEKPALSRSPSGSSYGDCELRKMRGDVANYGDDEDDDDDNGDDDGDNNTEDSKPLKYDNIDWDDLTSGFVDAYSEFTGAPSWIESVL